MKRLSLEGHGFSHAEVEGYGFCRAEWKGTASGVPKARRWNRALAPAAAAKAAVNGS